MSSLKTMVRGSYDIQKLRIQMGNRIVGNFKAKLGQAPSRPERELTAEGKEILKAMRESFGKIADGVTSGVPSPKKFKGDEVISSYTELCLFAQYIDLEKHEDQHFRRLGVILKDYPVYNEFLTKVSGCGPAMSGVIISEIDISKARYPSSLWKYAGLDVGPDGRGRSRRKEHLVPVEYTDKDGKPAIRDSITFNPFLKTKLTGVLGPCFLRSGKSQYAEDYRNYKFRLENHATYGSKNDGKKDDDGKQITSKGRRHNMAIRYAVKRFLVDLHCAWRAIEGLPVSEEYSEAKLGMRHKAV